MSNLIYACWRQAPQTPPRDILSQAAERIRPAGLQGHDLRISASGLAGLCLTGPIGAAALSGMSAHTGVFAGPHEGWERIGASVPEGSFALIRSDDEAAELCMDFAGSRTLWYAWTDDRFFASTSQRALACLLGGLDLDRQAFAWFLSSGSLGPSAAWDKRVRRLPAGARLSLDRRQWTLRLQEGARIAFDAQAMDREQGAATLGAALRRAIHACDFASARWALPLSGGYDCRYILATLHEAGQRPRTVTWGMAASLRQPGNDAFVAKALAERLGLQHDYLLTDPSEEAPQAVADRFLEASGGTTDQLFPYLDGLKLWRTLAGQGVDGIIRGDEGFGWIPVRSEVHARASVGLVRLEDFMEPAMAEEAADGVQAMPEDLARRPGESIPAYRDRLYHGFRIPVGLAALTDVKTPFVEVASPLLARSVLETVRTMPDTLRTDKAVFRLIAKAAGPALPYATTSADDDRHGYLRSEAYTRWFQEELENGAAALLPARLKADLLKSLRGPAAAPSQGRSLRAALKRILPTPWIRAVRARLGPAWPAPRHLALRAALASRAVRMLEADGRSSGQVPAS